MLHLIKLAVGVDSFSSLGKRQSAKLEKSTDFPGAQSLTYVTRNMPRRADEILKGGSIYWVIKRFILARQRITDIKASADRRGKARCVLVLDPQLVRVLPRPHRPFQGWRYIGSTVAPEDDLRSDAGLDEIPPKMAGELRRLGLL